MKTLLASLALLAIILGIGLYAAGWLTVERDADRATIEIDTGAIDNATDQALEKSKQWIDETVKPDPTTDDVRPDDRDDLITHDAPRTDDDTRDQPVDVDAVTPERDDEIRQPVTTVPQD